ncbi:Rhamnogalacturonate lyase family protein [Forsythia ovata]|uniref:rhamnogalacturonan endolyase n=1 Tax=Forsythia ovata TaxID=205694 RepID=A0ABD1UA14_9LAMI
MGKGQVGRWQKLIVWWLGMELALPFFSLINCSPLHGRALEDSIQDFLPANGVQLLQQKQQVVMNNGIVSLTLTNPGGLVTDIRYQGSDNLLETQNGEDNRGYWDVTWNKPGENDNMDKLLGTSYKVIVQNIDQIEISFISTWDVKVGNAKAPLNVDKRFVMLRDSPGFYTYTVLERLKGWPAFDIQEGRIVFKLQENKFHFMAMSDQRQRIMPMPRDRETGRVLDYQEAVLLTNPTNPTLKGEVDDKYLFSCDNKDNKIHGWISINDPVPIGFWMITPSNEFRTGGPLKQDLTSHVGSGATMLSMFISTHYAGEDLALKFQSDEYWKKVFGPVHVYFNSDVRAKQRPSVLWNDAKQRMLKETTSWPYNFPLSKDFLKSNQRGAVSGQLLVHDWFINKKPLAGASAYVGLAPPGAARSWQTESKGYQFWTQADPMGNFVINNVVPGTYSLFAWVPGTIGDYKHASDITIKPGSNIKLRNVLFEPPRVGPTLWEIGIADRTAAEFFIPDPSPSIKIHQYKNTGEKFRQYGLWARYKDLYPNNDLVYTIGRSDYRKDWFFAHVTRNVGTGVFESPTWQIKFDLENVNKGATYTLQVALASANVAELQVRFNDPNLVVPDFRTGQIGRDNAIARHGIHGLYYLYNIGITGSRLVDGSNTIFLTQARSAGPFREIMYDYLRFEGPSPTSQIASNIGA